MFSHRRRRPCSGEPSSVIDSAACVSGASGPMTVDRAFKCAQSGLLRAGTRYLPTKPCTLKTYGKAERSNQTCLSAVLLLAPAVSVRVVVA